MESVLVGVDHSEQAVRALRFGLARARVNDWRVSIVHVVNWARWYNVPTLPELQERPLKIKKERAAIMKNLLEPLVAEMEKDGLLEGLSVETSVHFGRPSEVLSDLVTEENHDIMVVGRTGESNLKQAIFGSTANRLAQYSPVPVIIVP